MKKYTFKKEINFYKVNKEKLLKLYHGKFLVIKDKYLLGISGNIYGANGMVNDLLPFYDSPIMIKQCLYNEPVAGIPGGLNWMDDNGKFVEPYIDDIKAYEEGSRIKFPPDTNFQSIVE